MVARDQSSPVLLEPRLPAGRVVPDAAGSPAFDEWLDTWDGGVVLEDGTESPGVPMPTANGVSR